ncbi:MAG: aminotransferase class I/II-fold pyridoxal phosphate-dependent enzyme, partial [Anaerococcus sp.]|nr:aminotransferase class I/II-fold pyridoxal phosphate-dependent enzyme [Anaerococcus sp.]
IILAKALGFKQNLDSSWKDYAKQIKANAKAMEEALREYNFKMVSDGTDNHLLLIDLTNKNINGAQAQDLLDKVNITTNKNTIPNEKLSPQVTSGLRIGTAAITSRGMKEAEAKKIIELIARTIDQKEELEIIKKEVLELTSKFPVYGC